MAKKKKSDRPKHVSIYYDQLLYDLDFMPNENAGIILKLIVWYAVGTTESKEKIDEMLAHIKTLPDYGWLTSLYHRLCSAIDEDLQAYAEVCEKRRQAVAKREEYKKEREISLGLNSNQMISNDNTCNQMISNTDTEYDTDTVTDSSYEEDNTLTHTRASSIKDLEEGYFIEAWKNKSWKECVCMNNKISSLSSLEKEWNDFCLDCKASAKVHDSINDVQEHFNHWLTKRLTNGTNKNNLSRSDQRSKESEERKQSVTERIAQRIANRQRDTSN